MKKNYIKLIGSIICAFSMVMTVALVAIGAQANDKTIEYVENVKYEQEDTAPTAPDGFSRNDGYLFAGWYVKGGENANTDGYSPVSEPEVGQSYFAKYVPSEVLGVKAQVSGQIMYNDTDKIQNSAEDNAIRFITSLDSTEYNHIGFNIKIDGTTYNQDAATTKSVYKILYGIGADKNEPMEDYYPDEKFHPESVYFKTYTFTTIPETAFDSDITVTPYWITLDGTRVDGPETVVKTVNYGRAWYYVDANVTEPNLAAPVGTYSNPYTTLAEAIQVEPEKLYPRLILKSDIEIDETVNVAKTMTIAGLETADPAKKITYKDEENNLFTITTAGNLTLDNLTLSGGLSAIRNEGGKVAATNLSISGQQYCGVYVNQTGYANLTNITITGGERGIQLYTGGNVDGNIVKIYSPSMHGVACGASTFEITDLTIDGSQAQAVNVYEGSTGIVDGGIIENTTNNGVDVKDSTVTLKGVDIIFDEALQNGEYSYHGVSANTSGLVTLDDVEIKYAPQNGIQLYSGSQILEGSKNVTITSPYSQGIKCGGEGSSFDIDTLNVTNSGDIGLNVYDSATGNVIGGNITDSGSYGVNVDNAATASMTGGAITDSNYHGVNVDNSSTVDLRGIEVKFEEVTGSIDGIYVTNNAQATLNEVTITKAPRHGLSIYSGAKVMESATVKIDYPLQSGIRCGNENSNFDIQGLEVTNSGTYGLEIFDTAKGTVTGGTITDSVNYGVYAYSGSDLTVKNVDVTFDKVTSGKINGVHVTGAATYVTMNGGTISKAPQHGVYVESGMIELQGNITISNPTNDSLYVSGSEAKATINGSVTTNGGARGLCVRQGASVQKGTNYSKIEINSPTGNGVALFDDNTILNVGDMTLTGCGDNGIFMRYGLPTATLTGTVTIDSVTGRGIRIYVGNLSASDAIINITTPKTFGITASAGIQEIGELNIDGAKGYAAVHADASANLTINSGHIQNSAQYGVNVNGSATIKIRNCVIENSGTADLQNQASATATFDLDSTVTYSTGYGKE